MNLHAPKVSIVSLVYNQAKFLPERIESVLSQTFQDFEWIIVDDYSTDGSQQILLSQLQDNPHVSHLVLHDHNWGCYESFNHALSLTQGEYIYHAAGDDICEKGFLEVCVDFLDKHPTAGLVHTRCQWIDGDGQRLKRTVKYSFLKTDYFHSGRDEFQQLIMDNYIEGPSVMFRRDCYTSLGETDTSFVRAADWEYWLRICTKYDIGYIAAPIAYRRWHGANLTASSYVSPREATESHRIIQKIFSSPAVAGWGLAHLKRRALRDWSQRLFGRCRRQALQRDFRLVFETLRLAASYDKHLWREPRLYAFAPIWLAIALIPRPLIPKMEAWWRSRQVYTLR